MWCLIYMYSTRHRTSRWVQAEPAGRRNGGRAGASAWALSLRGRQRGDARKAAQAVTPSRSAGPRRQGRSSRALSTHTQTTEAQALSEGLPGAPGRGAGKPPRPLGASCHGCEICGFQTEVFLFFATKKTYPVPVGISQSHTPPLLWDNFSSFVYLLEILKTVHFLSQKTP